MLEKLKGLIKEVMPEIDVSKITLDTRLTEDLHFDSLAFMMLAMNIEEEFNISFDEPMNFATVKEVVDYLESHKK